MMRQLCFRRASSDIPLNEWLLATHLMAASKKGISAHQLYRTIGLAS